MNKRSLVTTLLLVAALLSFAVPAAAEDNGPVGTRIGFYGGSWQEFPAGAPFNIRHGWVQTSYDGAIGIFDFKLEVDGVIRNVDYRMFSEEGSDPEILTRLFVYNFPNGMTGVHTFTGHWYAPCQYAVDDLGYAGTCATPNEKVETNSKTMVVTFVP